MSRIPAWVGVFILVATVPAVGLAGVRFVQPGLDDIGRGGYRADRIELQLRPMAAATARATVALARRAAPQSSRPVVSSLHLDVVDRVAASVGVIGFEPEFRGESPPGRGRGTDFTAFYLASLAPGANVEKAVAALRALPDVASADPIAVLPVSMVPNDSMFAQSWWYGPPPGINATAAWDLSAGDSSIIIAILDTGVLASHPDIGGTVAGRLGQIWTNPGEANGAAGVDDDGDGFIDDVHGWDFVNLSGSGGVTPGEDWQYEDNDPKDYAGHGTLVAGLAAAITNNTIGASGTAFRSRIMPLRVGWSAVGGGLGVVDMSYVAQAIRYATKKGASVINCSFQTADQAGLIAAADSAASAGILVVNAAGNNTDPCGVSGSDCHELADHDNVLAVGAIDATGHVASFSNTGEFVDVYGPGQGIQSTFLYRVPGDTVAVPAYSQPIDGTSFPTPMASGTAAMVLAYDRAQGRPPLRPMELLFRLRENAVPLGTTSAPSTLPVGGPVGQLDAARAINNPGVSFAVRAAGLTKGAALGLQTTGTTRIAVYATWDSALIYLSSRGDTLRRVPLGAGVVGLPASADLGNGRGVGVFVALDNATVAGFDGYGNALPGWPVAADAADAPSFGPSLGDVDGDGGLEVVCVAATGVVYVWHADGTPLPPFPVPTDGTTPAGPAALADLDSSPGLEIVVTTFGGRVYTFHNDPTTPLRAGWPKSLATLGPLAPLVLRLGSTGPIAIVVVYGNSIRAYSASGGIVFTKPLGGYASQDPLAADVNGDGIDEILVPTGSPDAIAAFDSTGTPLTGWAVALPSGVYGNPLVRVPAPFNPAAVTMLVPIGTGLTDFGPDGSARGEFPKPGHAGAAPTLFDLGGDSRERVLAGSGSDGLVYFYLPPEQAWSLDAAKSWTTPRGNFARTGSRLNPPASGEVNNVPARVTDLAATSTTDTSVTLGWTATGDDSVTGRPKEYDLSTAWALGGGSSPQPASPRHWIFPATVDAGGHESRVIDQLQPGTVYRLALVARDAQGEQSLPSNAIVVQTKTAGIPPLSSVRGPAVLSLAQPSRLPATLFWKAAPGTTRQMLSIYDLAGRLRRRFDLGPGSEGSVTWDGADGSGRRLESGVYFIRLVSGSANADARIVLVR